MYKKCKYCNMYFDNEEQEWLRWNGKESEYCSQDCERKDEFYANGGIDDDDEN